MRIDWIDYIKTLCISLMVLGHAGVDEWTGKLIYSFHMPMLFVISGYLYKPQSCIKTVRKLILPLIFFSFLRYFCFVIKSFFIGDGLTYVIDWTSYYKGESGSPLLVGQWFLLVLFICRLLLGDISCFKFIRRNYKIVFSIMVLWMTLFDSVLNLSLVRSHYLYTTVGALPFMGFGLYLREKTSLMEIATSKAVVLLVFSFTISLLNERVDMVYGKYGYNYLIVLTSVCLVTISFITLFQRCPQNNFIQTISNGTLLVLGIHVLIFSAINDITNHIEVIPIISSFYKTVIVLLISYCLTPKCLKHVPWIIGK